MTTPTPRFSIIIPCYNQGAFLGECLASIARQTLAPFEVIVVDDGSTDPATIATLDELCVEPIVLVRQENRGLPGARNAGVARARGDFLLPLDADDQLTPDALEAYARAIAADPSVDIWYPDVEHFGLEEDFWPAPEFNRWRQLDTNLMICASAIARRVFDGGVRYNESMRGGYEDWEFYVHACCERDFVARGLERPVFRYRRWGFSMLSASNQRAGELRAQIQRERPIYRDEARLLKLKQTHSPFFAIAAQSATLAPALAAQECGDYRVVDASGRALSDGDLAVFQDAPGRALLVSCDDARLAQACAADPFLLEKIARAFEARDLSLLWLVTARDAATAYPGVLVPVNVPLGEVAERAVGFVFALRHAFAHPGIPRTDAGLLADLAAHVEATTPERTRACIVGAQRSLDKGDEGLPLPAAAARAGDAAGAAGASTAVAIGKRLSQATRAIIGAGPHDRLWQMFPMPQLRDWLEPPLLPSAAPEPVAAAAAPPVATREGPLGSELDRRRRDGRWAIACQPARYRGRRDGDGATPATLAIAVPWIVHGGVDRGIVDFVQAARRLAPALRLYVITTVSAKMTWADRVLPHVDGVFSLADRAGENGDEAFCDLLDRLGASALLIANSAAAYDALPTLRTRKQAVRVVAQLHSFQIDRKTGKAFGYPVYAPSRYNNLIDAYATISQTVTDRLTREYYVSPAKAWTVPLGIDVDWYAQARTTRFQPGRPATVLWLGRLSEEKDPLMFVRVAAAWKARHGAARARFVIVGGGELEAEVRAACVDAGVADVLSVAGATDVPLGFYRAADCLMLTSRYEGIPIVLYEAMAAGLPVITTTRDTSIPDVVSEDEAFFVRDQKDVSEYVRALERLLDDPDGARRRGERMAELAVRHRAERYARETLELLGLWP
jgi:glycosyltransferase involved in cell wall biosynthesis